MPGGGLGAVTGPLGAAGSGTAQTVVTTAAELAPTYTWTLTSDLEMLKAGITGTATLTIAGATVGAFVTILAAATGGDRALTLPDGTVITVPQGGTSVISGAYDGTTWRFFEAGSGTDAYPASNVSGAAGRLWLPTGAKLENFDRARTALADVTVVGTSGTLKLQPLGVVRAGHTISSVTFWKGATAATSPTHQWACMVRKSDRQVMAVSPDATTGAWAAVTPKTFTFSSPYTPAVDELMWVGLLMAATTPGTHGGFAYSPAESLGGPVIAGNSNAALTTPLATGTIVTAPSGNQISAAYCFAS